MKFFQKPVILVIAVFVNSALFLLIPLLQVIYGKVPDREKKNYSRVLDARVVKKKEKRIDEKPIKIITTLTRSFKPSTPKVRNVSLNLSAAQGGEGVEIQEGRLEVGILEVGQTDTDAEIISGPREPKMPLRARREQIGGYVDIMWVVNESGMATQMEIIAENPPGYGFGKVTKKYLKDLRFRPATLKKVPVKQRLKQRIRFNVE